MPFTASSQRVRHARPTLTSIIQSRQTGLGWWMRGVVLIAIDAHLVTPTMRDRALLASLLHRRGHVWPVAVCGNCGPLAPTSTRDACARQQRNRQHEVEMVP